MDWKDLEGSVRGLIQTLARNFPGGAEEGGEKSQAGCPGRN
jgi:hypothetical protein